MSAIVGIYDMKNNDHPKPPDRQNMFNSLFLKGLKSKKIIVEVSDC